MFHVEAILKTDNSQHIVVVIGVLITLGMKKRS
jgi:hypothetical protein